MEGMEGEGAKGEEIYKHFLLPEIIVPKILTFDEAAKCLSNFGKDESGVRYAYLMISPTDMKLTDVSKIICFKHILFVDVSGNYLELEGIQILSQIPYLILLKAERNKITSGALKLCPYLQVLDLNRNQITETNDIKQPSLEILEMAFNNIYDSRFNSNYLKELKQLDLTGNQLTELSGDFPTSIEFLYLGQNKIYKINGFDLSKLINLKHLHLRDNKIHKLDGFSTLLENLKYLNLRQNNIKKLRQFRKLFILPKLEELIMSENPVMDKKIEKINEEMGEEEEPEAEEEKNKSDQIRISILVMLPKLKRINKELVTPEERDEAFFIREERIEEIMQEASSDEESIIPTTTDITSDYTTETEVENFDQNENEYDEDADEDEEGENEN